MSLAPTDVVTIGLLVLLEGLLSADNALVIAVMVLGLPKPERKQALGYGLIGGFAFRIVATLLAIYLIKLEWVKLGGALYLGYLTVTHFTKPGGAEARQGVPKATAAFGLSAFWATVIRVEVVNLAFSVDSILVAVAMSPKIVVVLSGGILGIVAMRVVVGKILSLIERYPPLVDGAFVIIGWVALKLLLEYAHQMAWVGWQVPQWLSLGLIVVMFGAAYVYARAQGPRPPAAAADGAIDEEREASANVTDEAS